MYVKDWSCAMLWICAPCSVRGVPPRALEALGALPKSTQWAWCLHEVQSQFLHWGPIVLDMDPHCSLCQGKYLAVHLSESECLKLFINIFKFKYQILYFMYLRPDSACLFSVVLPAKPMGYLKGKDLPAYSFCFCRICFPCDISH